MKSYRPYLATTAEGITLLEFWRDLKGRVFADLHQRGATPFPVNSWTGLSPDDVDVVSAHYERLGVPVRFAWEAR